MRQPLQPMGQRAVEVLLKRIAEQNDQSGSMPLDLIMFVGGFGERIER